MVDLNTKASHEKTNPDQVPIIWLGMPLYNHRKYLRKTLDSLLAQIYGNFRLVIAHDSTEPGPTFSTLGLNNAELSKPSAGTAAIPEKWYTGCFGWRPCFTYQPEFRFISLEIRHGASGKA